MNENMNIDQLLNAYIDDELNARQQTEVKRLLDHDPAIAEKLHRLQNCKMLVNSLPAAQAPEHLFDDIRAALERNTLLNEPAEHLEQRKGAAQLVLRKVLSAAAMLALLAGLALVVMNVIMPPANIDPQNTIVQETPPVIPATDLVAIETPAAPAIVFNGKLELSSLNFDSADNFIAKAVTDNDLVENVTTSGSTQTGKTFMIACSRQKLLPFLSQLAKGWYQFDSSTLTVAAAKNSMTVDTVTARQLIDIASHSDTDQQLKAAQYFAFTNNLKNPSPIQNFTAKDNPGDFLNIPQPVMTSPNKSTAAKDLKDQLEQKVQLVIVLSN